jgi:hypothetical protein
MIRQLQVKEGYEGGVTASYRVALTTQFHDDKGDVQLMTFETGHQGREAERLTRFIWDRTMHLLLMGKEWEANSLLEEFDEPPLWDDPLN